MAILPGDYIAGLVDGEGCFALNYRKETKLHRRGQPSYYRWTAYFYVVLSENDVEILEALKETLSCGKIFFLKRQEGWGQMAQYACQSLKDIVTKVIPFFRRYHLRAKKRHDFELWAEGAETIFVNRGNRYTVDLHKKLLALRDEMKQYKAKSSRPYLNSPEVS